MSAFHRNDIWTTSTDAGIASFLRGFITVD